MNPTVKNKIGLVGLVTSAFVLAALIADGRGLLSVHAEEIKITQKDTWKNPEPRSPNRNGLPTWVQAKDTKGHSFRVRNTSYYINAGNGHLKISDGETIWKNVGKEETACVLSGYSYFNSAVKAIAGHPEYPDYEILGVLPPKLCQG